jgi:predicted MPP superfamily phosphohydrolase
MYDAEVKNKKKKSKGKKVLKAIGIILLVIILLDAAIAGGVAITNAVTVKSLDNAAESFAPVEYEAQLEPSLDANGRYTFVTDGDFKIMQLTDIHIGAGFMSSKVDNMALNAVAAMITAEKPDLVCVSGDIAFPIPYQSGTINNKTAATVFADLMEQLGVYWAPVFGNHDTEAFSYYTREEIGALYESSDYPHCLFQAGNADVHGVGNYVINVKDSAGNITESIFMIDSNDYIDKSLKSTINWVYDCIHEDQIEWYASTLEALQVENGGVMPKSIAFFHIPLAEMKTAWRNTATIISLTPKTCSISTARQAKRRGYLQLRP